MTAEQSGPELDISPETSSSVRVLFATTVQYQPRGRKKRTVFLTKHQYHFLCSRVCSPARLSRARHSKRLQSPGQEREKKNPWKGHGEEGGDRKKWPSRGPGVKLQPK